MLFRSQLSYIPDAAIAENIQRFISYHLASSMAWNVPRALFTALLIIAIGPGVLKALERSARKAAFVSEIKFI